MAVYMYEEQPKKISGFLEHPVTRAINFKIWPILQRKLPKNGHFFSHFLVLAIKLRRINLFQNRFHRWSTFWPYFPGTLMKVKLMAIIGCTITPIMTNMAILGVMARPIIAISLTFTGVPGKYGQNVDQQWKRFWKRCILHDFMAKTKKYEKKWQFLGNFLCIIGRILKVLALYPN